MNTKMPENDLKGKKLKIIKFLSRFGIVRDRFGIVRICLVSNPVKQSQGNLWGGDLNWDIPLSPEKITSAPQTKDPSEDTTFYTK